MNELSFQIKEIEKLMSAGEQGYVQECEIRLAEICESGDPRIIGELAVRLNDNCDDELLWSIIHCIEDFDSEIYVENILPVLVTIFEKSPQWASILIIRMLNDAECTVLLRESLNRMEDKQVLSDVATYTANKWSKQANTVKEVFKIS